jgi:hypothetical protein
MSYVVKPTRIEIYIDLIMMIYGIVESRFKDWIPAFAGMASVISI